MKIYTMQAETKSYIMKMQPETKSYYIMKISFLLISLIFLATMKVGAYIPVPYICCQNYSFSNGNLLNRFEDVSNSGIQLDNFGNISNWTVGGTGASQQIDTVNYIYGTQGLKLIATNGNRANTDKIINNSFATTNNFVVWMYVYNVSTAYYGTMYITSNGSNWNTYFKRTLSDFQPGWNKLISNKEDFIQGSLSNPESWNNTMNKIRLSITPYANTNTNVTFDNLKYNMNNDWMIGGSGVYLQSDTTNFIEGKQGLKLVDSNGTGYMELAINNNFSTTNNFAIWTYIDNASNYSGITLYLTSNGSNWNTFFYDSEWAPGVKTGWNHLIFNKHNFKNVGGEDWNNIMNKVRLRTYPTKTNLNTTFDNLAFNMSGQRAKIIFNFDDGTLSHYLKAYPILNANNQSAVEYVITSWVGGSLHLNVSTMKILQSAGWDISSHTVDHPHLSSLNDSSLTSELNDSYTWLVNNGFQKSAGFIAYPYGDFNDNIINKTQQRYIFGRGISPNWNIGESQQYTTVSDNTIQYIQRTISSTNQTTQSITDQINDSINAKLLAILFFHKINDSNPTNDPYTFLTSDFQNISNYVKSRNADIDVITYSDDYVIPQINNFTPVINKTTRIYSNGSSNIITKNKYDEYMPNMTIMPSSDLIDINITTYDQTGGGVKFNESSPNSSIKASYHIGDRTPNWLYNVNIYWPNGTLGQNFSIYANNTGYINYNSTGFQDPRYQYIEPQAIDTSFTITVPLGYTILRFNANNSNVKNLDADGQTSSQPFFNIMNTGNINQNYILYLNNNPTNINTYADLDSNFSTGRIQLKPSISTILVPNLGPGNSQSIWMIIDANHASPTNKNATLMINTVTQIPEYVSNNCDPTLWNHVWGENQNLTYRLLLNPTYSCINVTGTINYISAETDGDYHLSLNLDPQYSSSLGNEIELEIVCSNANSTNQAVCNNFNLSYLMNNISNGVRISVTGAYVIDVPQLHTEIHPVTSIGPVILRKVANTTSYKNVGDIIQYNYSITNIGNIVLNGFSIIDNKTGIIPCPGILYPGQYIQCTSNYTIVQSDINNGTVTNNAYVSIVYNDTIINSNLAITTVSKQ